MATPARTVPLDVFISYSHKDEDLRDALMEHLAALQRERLIRVWHDRKIPAGAAWAGEIDDRLRAAHIVLLLVSPSFIDSDYCYVHELKAALDRREKEGIQVIPVVLRPVEWKGTAFAHLQALPRGGKPVVEWTNRDAALLDVVATLRRLITGEPLEESSPADLATAAPAQASPKPRRSARLWWLTPLAVAVVMTLLTRAYFWLTISAGQLNASETLVVFGFWTAACFGIQRLLRR